MNSKSELLTKRVQLKSISNLKLFSTPTERQLVLFDKTVRKILNLKTLPEEVLQRFPAVFFKVRQQLIDNAKNEADETDYELLL